MSTIAGISNLSLLHERAPAHFYLPWLMRSVPDQSIRMTQAKRL
jgi:hypothetical protein